MVNMPCFRGEKRNRWGAPELRLHYGLTLRGPWLGGMLPHYDIEQTWQELRNDMRQQAGGRVNAYGQYLRAEGRAFAIAAARTREGAFDDDYNYEFLVPDARTFLWGANDTLGAEVQWAADPAAVRDDYVVLNADTIDASTVLAFGHKALTREVTFFSDIPTDWITRINDLGVDQWPLKPRNEWTLEERNTMRALVRPPAT